MLLVDEDETEEETDGGGSTGGGAGAAAKDDTPPLPPVGQEDEEEMELAKDTLPPYLPAIQGCRSVEEFQCLNRYFQLIHLCMRLIVLVYDGWTSQTFHCAMLFHIFSDNFCI